MTCDPNVIQLFPFYKGAKGDPGASTAEAEAAAQAAKEAADTVLAATELMPVMVDNLAALKLVDTTKHKKAITLGYWTPGDKGGGAWFFTTNTAVADDATVVRGVGGWWILVGQFNMTVQQFGVQGGGLVDDTARLQAAINWSVKTGGRIYAPADVYRTTAPLVVGRKVNLYGDDVSPYEGWLYPGPGTRGLGTWFLFDHPGRGFMVGGTGQPTSGVKFSDFGTFRNQPVPAANWTPGNFDYDIYVDSADMYLNNITFLNSTNGVFVTNGNYGRLEVNRLRGQCMKSFVRIDEAYDVVKLHALHGWSMWADNPDVINYQNENYDFLYFRRCDNPMVSDVFSIHTRAAFRFGQSDKGSTSKIKVSNYDADLTKYGIWVDGSVTSGVTGQFVNFTAQGYDKTVGGSIGIHVEGIGGIYDFNNLSLVNFHQNGVRAPNVGAHYFNFAGKTRISHYDRSGSGFPAIEVGRDTVVRIDGKPDIDGSLSPRYGSLGTIFVDEWRPYIVQVSALGGTIGQLGFVQGVYKLYNDTVHYDIDVTLAQNGTASNAIRCSVPYPIWGFAGGGSGREVALTGKGLVLDVRDGNSYVDIRDGTNSYVGGDGAHYTVAGFYRVKM
ncbi:hypothetical protein [Burkholderia phage vB_BpP_HN05]